MGNASSIFKINFEEMQKYINQQEIIINTLSSHTQDCLIQGTLDISKEVTLLNEAMKTNAGILIIIYGRNASDESIVAKFNQLSKLGFTNIKVYPGGIFEWLLLQDIYGKEDFPTTSNELDILKYK